ncbi:MAG: hypothetical protein HHJ14_07985 [Cellulomonas sp.]|uniref:DUF6188 family protein n=1 Tax=Cellulomonas sp. TaxID=40001 RepID=UPI0017C6994A|nr:DUF6188 family protein [Cellulomonas sp.]NMM17068.1 hypothetical protein [Cellulomonas sp.]NMM30262.1 hypothetical protein [Cellulomonas sp.]
MEYSLEGQEVSRLCLDYAVVLQTVDGTELRIESPFRLSSHDGAQTEEVRPDCLDQAGSAVVGLLRQRIESAFIDESGALSLRFANGLRLDSEPDEHFEAWTLVTADGERMVCLPGGGVAHWPGGSRP